MGADAYMVAENEWGFTSGAVHKARLLQQASDYCTSLGKQMVPTNSAQNDVAWGKTPGAEVQFRCVANPIASEPGGAPPATK